MIEFSIKKGRLELDGYSDDTTLNDLLRESEAFLNGLTRKSAHCRMCGECCHRPPVLGLDIQIAAEREGLSVPEWAARNLLLPEMPDLKSRERGVEELRRQLGVSNDEATVLYEYNNSEPVTFLHNEADRCFFQRGNLCGYYDLRPYICRLYLCRFGEKLQDLEEMIVSQGTWHAYMLLGALPPEAIGHNPFLNAKSYDDVLLKKFEVGLEGAAEELFKYF